MATNRMGTRLDNLTEEQRAAVERIRARHRAPEYREQEGKVRELVREDFPPAVPDADLSSLLAALKSERERRNVSLSEMHERTGIDRATISKDENGHVPNPTWATLRAYARALGLRISASLEPVSSPTIRDLEFCEDPSGAPYLLVPAEDLESLCDYFGCRGIACRERAPAEPSEADGSHRVMLALDPDTDRRRIRALAHRWKLRARGRRDRDPVTPAFE